MAEEYVCGDCGQRSDEEFCPLCETKMVRIGDYNDTSYESDLEDSEEEFTEIDGDYDFDGLDEEELAESI